MNWVEDLFARGGVAKELTGLIHVGASWGQEVPYYETLNVPVLMFEPLPGPFADLQRAIQGKPLFAAEQLAAGPNDGTATIYASTKRGVSSSLLRPQKHLEWWPNSTFAPTECREARLDTYLADVEHEYNALVMDAQGYELHVFEGAEELLRRLRYVALEVWRESGVYEGSPDSNGVAAFLAARGFRVAVETTCNARFGKALFERAA